LILSVTEHEEMSTRQSMEGSNLKGLFCGSERASCASRFSLAALMTMGLLLFLTLGLPTSIGAETTMPENQVKALFLLNFAKYVEWPAEAFADEKSAIIIGAVSSEAFEENLKKAVEGRTINGRPVVACQIVDEKDLSKCQILFIAGSDRKHTTALLGKVKALPILTVGEADQFLEEGGIINFVKKEGKVRLEIDLNAARAARLQLSSKLLSVADSVKGKP
jgi:YfiR/HmsC-like